MRPAVDFRVGVDEVIERLGAHPGERKITTDCEENAVLVVGAEKVLSPTRVLMSLGCIEREPPVPVQVELYPAVVPADLAIAPTAWKRKPDLESRGDSQRP